MGQFTAEPFPTLSIPFFTHLKVGGKNMEVAAAIRTMYDEIAVSREAGTFIDRRELAVVPVVILPRKISASTEGVSLIAVFTSGRL